jgi:hypothetical protein
MFTIICYAFCMNNVLLLYKYVCMLEIAKTKLQFNSLQFNLNGYLTIFALKMFLNCLHNTYTSTNMIMCMFQMNSAVYLPWLIYSMKLRYVITAIWCITVYICYYTYRWCHYNSWTILNIYYGRLWPTCTIFKIGFWNVLSSLVTHWNTILPNLIK